MAQASNITVNDATSPTPVAHTFEPSRIESDFAQYEDRAVGVYAGYGKLTLSLKRPAPGGAQNLKLGVKIDIPVMEALAPADTGFTPQPTVAYRNVCEVTMTFPARSSKQQRSDIFTMLRNVLTHTPVVNLVENYAVPN